MVQTSDLTLILSNIEACSGAFSDATNVNT